jgi:hypothetical protein
VSRDTYLRRDGKRHRGTAPKKHDLPACPVTGKVSYSTRAKAKKAIGRAKSIRVYKCPHEECPYWHRTSSRSRRKRKK